MQLHQMNDMVKGWFVGHFTPTAYTTDAFEVGVKIYQAGDQEPAHHHRQAIELTVIVTGRVRMFGREFSTGDIITVERGESTAFEALEDTITVVVKTPSVPNDKFLDA
jgi:mannose-6-phosphate isomerase-like protein (cupin superfamily)